MTNFDGHTEDTKQDFGKSNSKYPKSSRNIDVLFDLKDGTHKFRIIPTVDNELVVVEKEYHDYVVDGEFKKVVVCPGYNECPICKVANEVDDSLLKPIRLNKSFIYLIDTDSPNEDWTPGNYYILLSRILYSKKDRFEEALMSYIFETLETGISGIILLGNLFDYTKETQGCLQVRVQSCKRYRIVEYLSNIDISFDPSTKSPKLDKDILKDFDYYMETYIDNLFKKLDPKELEEDAKKLRLKYNNKRKTF